MSELIDELREKLEAPFSKDDLEWRLQQSGSSQGNKPPWAKAVAYVTNRAIMARLDDVFGPWGWSNEYKQSPNGKGTICGISIMHPEEKGFVTKWDGADDTNIEATKGGLSDSMKRAAVQWGIGRYLYKIPVQYAETTTERPKNQHGWNYAKVNNISFYWKDPELPESVFQISKLPVYLDATPKIQRKALKNFKDACEFYDVDPIEFMRHHGQECDSMEDKYKSVRTWLNGDPKDFDDQLQNYVAYLKDE